MNEYSEILKIYSDAYYSIYCGVADMETWPQLEAAEQFLEKYWMLEKTYDDVWFPIFERIFGDIGYSVSEVQFPEQYVVGLMLGGCLFLESDYLAFTKYLLSIGEAEFAIVRFNNSAQFVDTGIRLVFPVGTSWEEFMSGGFVSKLVAFGTIGACFVVGRSGNWGIFTDNDAWYPYIAIGNDRLLRKEMELAFGAQMKEFSFDSERLPRRLRRQVINGIG